MRLMSASIAATAVSHAGPPASCARYQRADGVGHKDFTRKRLKNRVLNVPDLRIGPGTEVWQLGNRENDFRVTGAAQSAPNCATSAFPLTQLTESDAGRPACGFSRSWSRCLLHRS
jgi:hypothetical protein